MGGRGGCLAQESRHAARASPPPRPDFQGANMQAGTESPPPDQNRGSGQASPPGWEGSRAVAPTPPPTPTPPTWHPRSHPLQRHRTAPLPSRHRARGFCPNISPSLPFLSGGFPSTAARGTVTDTVSQATPPTHSQPHSSRACFVIPFSDSSFFTCHPVLLLLSSQLPPAWLWSSPS